MAGLVEEAAAQAAIRRRQGAAGRRAQDAGRSPIQSPIRSPAQSADSSADRRRSQARSDSAHAVTAHTARPTQPAQFDVALHADFERDQWSDDSLWPGTVANPRRTRVR